VVSLLILKDYGLLFALCSLKNTLHQHQYITSENFSPAHCGTHPVFYLTELSLQQRAADFVGYDAAVLAAAGGVLVLGQDLFEQVQKAYFSTFF
jgi:hypothetical protein